ncbi:response regulator [Sphingomonas crocodyli]|uniref:response regulator n=1 Tax=Sphingomonas crocodyli TaxID=1979270 RepID=UPI0013E3C6CA|nr:response regulator [Sphingomonas crocodyli]
MDDEPAYAQIMSALAASMGHRLDHVANAADLPAWLDTKQYALILMDVEMPGIDGYKATAAIRSRGGWAIEVPIIAFTTLGKSRDADRFVAAGMDGVLAKPFGIVESAATLRQWLHDGKAPKRTRQTLEALLGAQQAATMFDRFYVSLAEAVELVDQGGDKARIGHKIGGLAGTLGLGVLSAAWLAMQDGGADHTWPTVRALSLDAIARRAG